MKMKMIIFLVFFALVSGCARVVTLKESPGDVFTLSVNFKGDILSSEKYYLILSTDRNFQAPEYPYEFQEPGRVLWNDLPEDDIEYLLNRYSTWTGYIVVDAMTIFRVKGPFSTTEEADASWTRREVLKIASEGRNLSFNFLLSDIFGGSLVPKQNIYFDIITTQHMGDAVYIADRISSSGNYIVNIKDALIQGEEGSDPSIDPGLNILDWTVSIQ